MLSISQNAPHSSIHSPIRWRAFHGHGFSRYRYAEFLKAGGLLERGAGNTVDKLVICLTRYWGDAFHDSDRDCWNWDGRCFVFRSTSSSQFVPFGKNVAMLPVQIGKGVMGGLGTVGKALADAPSAFRKG